MSKPNKSIQEKLESRSPATMRQIIKPIDMLENESKQPEQTNEGMNVHTNERSNEYSNERIKEHTSERPKERTRIRHSFDVFQDQLDDLREIALQQQKATRKRVLLGDLVQEALDIFITAQKRTNERSNE